MKRYIIRFVSLSFFSIVFSTAALAASVPYTFTDGTTASADEVNANFEALVAAVTALEAKHGPHTMQSLAGTYDYFEVSIDVDSPSDSSQSISGGAASGTVVLNENGTLQISLSLSSRELSFNTDEVNDNPVVVDFINSPETFSSALTWSYANGVVSVSGDGGDFRVVGQLLIQSIFSDGGKNGLTILARREAE